MLNHHKDMESEVDDPILVDEEPHRRLMPNSAATSTQGRPVESTASDVDIISMTQHSKRRKGADTIQQTVAIRRSGRKRVAPLQKNFVAQKVRKV